MSQHEKHISLKTAFVVLLFDFCLTRFFDFGFLMIFYEIVRLSKLAIVFCLNEECYREVLYVDLNTISLSNSTWSRRILIREIFSLGLKMCNTTWFRSLWLYIQYIELKFNHN